MLTFFAMLNFFTKFTRRRVEMLLIAFQLDEEQVLLVLHKARIKNHEPQIKKFYKPQIKKYLHNGVNHLLVLPNALSLL
jgi:hypothetical protein